MEMGWFYTKHPLGIPLLREKLEESATGDQKQIFMDEMHLLNSLSWLTSFFFFFFHFKGLNSLKPSHLMPVSPASQRERSPGCAVLRDLLYSPTTAGVS